MENAIIFFPKRERETGKGRKQKRYGRTTDEIRSRLEFYSKQSESLMLLPRGDLSNLAVAHRLRHSAFSTKAIETVSPP